MNEKGEDIWNEYEVPTTGVQLALAFDKSSSKERTISGMRGYNTHEGGDCNGELQLEIDSAVPSRFGKMTRAIIL